MIPNDPFEGRTPPPIGTPVDDSVDGLVGELGVLELKHLPAHAFCTSDLSVAATLICYQDQARSDGTEIKMLGFYRTPAKRSHQKPRIVFVFAGDGPRGVYIGDLFLKILNHQTAVEPLSFVANYRHLRAMAEGSVVLNG